MGRDRRIQYHPTFCAAAELEFRANKGQLDFHQEHEQLQNKDKQHQSKNKQLQSKNEQLQDKDTQIVQLKAELAKFRKMFGDKIALL